MNTNIKIRIFSLAAIVLLAACNETKKEHSGHQHDAHADHDHSSHEHHDHSHEDHGHEGEHAHEEEVILTARQFKALDMQIDSLPMRNLSAYVETSGQLEAAPEDEAVVTAIIGANIANIKAVEGEKVKKGQVLAYLSHPDLIKLQTDYVNNWNQLQYLEKEYQRQKRLFEEEVGSGMEFQQTQANFQSMKGTVKGMEGQLKLLGLNPATILDGEIYERVPVRSPISGYLRQVGVRNGQYVEPQMEMFGIMNIDHIHALFMVFEKDIQKVKEDQKVLITLEALPDKEIESTVHVIGKTFEQNLKAVRIHADIDNKDGRLIPGMYVTGRILTGDTKTQALPESGVVREGDKHFIFTVQQNSEKNEWIFTPVEVLVGNQSDGWIEVQLIEPIAKDKVVAWNNAYYLMAELKKSEAEHSH
jgi:cobalt-zinc-cadmium efflux system membrane fusion protein